MNGMLLSLTLQYVAVMTCHMHGCIVEFAMNRSNEE